MNASHDRKSLMKPNEHYHADKCLEIDFTSIAVMTSEDEPSEAESPSQFVECAIHDDDPLIRLTSAECVTLSVESEDDRDARPEGCKPQHQRQKLKVMFEDLFKAMPVFYPIDFDAFVLGDVQNVSQNYATDVGLASDPRRVVGILPKVLVTRSKEKFMFVSGIIYNSFTVGLSDSLAIPQWRPRLQFQPCLRSQT